MKAAQSIAILLLGGILLVKGIIPAFQSVGMDFANYYTSSYVLVYDRGNVHRLYDKAWFSERARELGSPEGGIFQPFPPATALVMVPLVAFDLKTAKALWTILNLGLLAFLVVTLSQLGRMNLPLAMLLILASGFALINNFFLGQVYLLMTLCMAHCFLFLRQNRESLAGFLAGVFIPIKYFPACLVILFLLQRRWTAMWSTLITAGAVLLVSVLWMNPEIHLSFLRSVVLPHLDGEMPNPFSATYQSWNSLFRSLFVHDTVFNPHPFWDSATAFVLARAIAIMTLVVLFVWNVIRLLKREHELAGLVMALFALVLLVAPATATYHFLVLSVPVGMIFSELSIEGRGGTPLLIVLLYVGIGGVPAGAMDQFGLSGFWKVLAYPRLYLLTGLFLVTMLAWNSGRDSWFARTREGTIP